MRRLLHNALQRLQIRRARLVGRLLRAEIEAPVFLIGCGRSGKSTIGAALALHPQVAFLDESRPLWIAFFPQTDIWSAQSRARGGRLHLNKQDADAESARRLRVLFRYEQGARAKLLQSLAANSFRLGFLRAVFPGAKFIHVVRDGVEVAAEIAQRIERQGWYGASGDKWRQLADYAALHPHTAGLPSLCENPFRRGLLEWRLCMEAIRAAQLPPDALLEIRYEELLAQPLQCLRRSAQFMGLDADPAWETRVLATMRTPAPCIRRAPDEQDLLIGGPFLSTT